MRPASSTATMRRSSTWPVSVSTSTTATWAPNGKVGHCVASKSSSARQPAGRRVGLASAATSRPRPADRRRAGHVEAAADLVEHDVVGVGLEQLGGELPRLVDELLRAWCTAAPPSCSEREPHRAAALGHQVGVAVDDVDLVHRDAELRRWRSSTTRWRGPARAATMPVRTSACRRARTSTAPNSSPAIGPAVIST